MYIFVMRTPKYLGVYSHGSHVADGLRKTLFFAWETSTGFAVQQLNKAFRPTAAPKRINIEYFTAHFSVESSILAMPLTALDERILEPEPAQQKPATAVPDTSLKASGLTSAKDAPNKMPATSAKTPEKAAGAKTQAPEEAPPDESKRRFLVKQTELRLRESFRQAVLRLKRPRDRQAALTALEHLASASDDIAPEHKHAFRDFGVRLRKDSKPDLARLFSQRVLDLAPDDDHAHFNLARVLCALKLYDEAANHIHTAIRLAPDETIYTRMLAHISKEKQRRPGVRSVSGSRR